MPCVSEQKRGSFEHSTFRADDVGVGDDSAVSVGEGVGDSVTVGSRVVRGGCVATCIGVGSDAFPARMPSSSDRIVVTPAAAAAAATAVSTTMSMVRRITFPTL
jgi:hypothetical protein